MSLYSTSTRGQCTPYTNEIVRFVKNNIKEPEAQPYVSRKIWMRTGNHRVEERKNQLWKKHFYRREDNMSKGFYSVPWESFQPMGGDIILDTGELVMKTLANTLRSRELQTHTQQDSEKSDTMPPVENPVVNESGSAESLATSAHSRSGFEDIMAGLRTTRDRISAVRAGMPYEEHVRITEDLSKGGDDQQDNDMVLMSLTDLHMMFMGSRKAKNDNQDAETEGSEFQSPSPQPMATSSPIGSRPATAFTMAEELEEGEDEPLSGDGFCKSEEDVASDVTSNKVLRVNSGLTERKERIRRNYLAYLNCIHDVIIYLRRMQIRDLRSKTPLSRENLRDLLKVPPENNSRLGQVRFSRNYNRRMSMSMDTSISGDTSSLSQEGGRLSIFGPSAPRRRSRMGSVFGAIGFASSRRKSRMWEREYMKVETWDDLMNLDNNMPNEGSPAAMTQNIILRTLKWSRRMSAQENGMNDSENKRTPIWQQIATEKSNNIFTEKNKQSNQQDAYMVVERLRHNMAKLKHNLRKEAESELNRINRARMVMYQFKIQCFDDMLPSSLFESHCERMQDTVHLINTNPQVEVQPSKWYEDLQERTHCKIASDDPGINDVLNKIGRFSQMGPKTLTYVKAKLCLLVMSLPAYEICKISMQSAIKFVMEKILVGQEDQFHHWLSLRKLPVVLVK